MAFGYLIPCLRAYTGSEKSSRVTRGTGSCSKLQNIFESQRFTNSLNYINFHRVDDSSSLSARYSLFPYKIEEPE
jgi:hypothetical protein